jgi:hypothetical protein
MRTKEGRMDNGGGLGRGVWPITIVWIAMLAAIPVYAAAGLLAAPTLPPLLDAGAFGVLRRVLYVAAAAILFLVGRVRRLVRGDEGLPAGQERASATSSRAAAAVIVSLAMCESVAIIGLVLYLLGRNTTDLFLLLGISAMAMVFHRPRAEEGAG